MTVLFQTNDGAVEDSGRQFQAVVRNAERMADLTAAALNEMGLISSPPKVWFSGTFLLELGAVLQIGLWERKGITAPFEAGIPSYTEAAGTLAERAAKNPSEFRTTTHSPLSDAVVQFWVDHFAWDGMQHMQADIIVGDIDEDQFIDLLATFLWEHRHQLTSFRDDGPSRCEG